MVHWSVGFAGSVFKEVIGVIKGVIQVIGDAGGAFTSGTGSPVRVFFSVIIFHGALISMPRGQRFQEGDRGDQKR